MAKKKKTSRTLFSKIAAVSAERPENLTKTECCGNWICDDEHKYVMFS